MYFNREYRKCNKQKYENYHQIFFSFFLFVQLQLSPFPPVTLSCLLPKILLTPRESLVRDLENIIPKFVYEYNVSVLFCFSLEK